MALMYILFLIIAIGADDKVLFKWDVKNLEDLFCENTQLSFDKESNTITKKDASQWLKTSKPYKKARRKLAIWPWEYQDSFEGECIEEQCQQGEITEFCSRKKKNYADAEANKKLNNRRVQRYEYCNLHVKKLVDGIKNTTNKDKELTAWQKELTPERLFRGWWEELKKAYLRFCLQDVGDCARRCNVETGLCRLDEDQAENEWVYKCECDPGYGPYMTDINEDQYQCSKKQAQTLDENSICSPLKTITDAGSDISINADYLVDHLHNKGTGHNRMRRVVAGDSKMAEAQHGFFPASVEIMSTRSCNLRGRAKCEKMGNQKGGDADNEKIIKHICGGTLYSLGDEFKGKTNIVVTAAHCFCHLTWDPSDFSSDPNKVPGNFYTMLCGEDKSDPYQCIRKPKAGHFFVRIGVLDNKVKPNLQTSRKDDNNRRHYHVEKDMHYIDVKVKSIRSKNAEYLTSSNCNSVNSNGDDDLAILELDGFIDVTDHGKSKGLQSHVKPACSVGDLGPEKVTQLTDTDPDRRARCFVSGWGQSQNNNTSNLSLPNNLQYIQVNIVEPNKCKEYITGDLYIQDDENLDRIICAEGTGDQIKASTCGGDSGGGLFCFDNNDNSYFLGPLHGGPDNCLGGSGLMYFTNVAHTDYRGWIQKIVQQQNIKQV